MENSCLGTRGIGPSCFACLGGSVAAELTSGTETRENKLFPSVLLPGPRKLPAGGGGRSVQCEEPAKKTQPAKGPDPSHHTQPQSGLCRDHRLPWP